VDTTAIPRDGVWQIQLKLSSLRENNVTSIYLSELSVTLDAKGGGKALQNGRMEEEDGGEEEEEEEEEGGGTNKIIH